MDEEKWPKKILKTTLEVILINCDYQLLWLKIMLNGKMQSNHPEMLSEKRGMLNWIAAK